MRLSGKLRSIRYLAMLFIRRIPQPVDKSPVYAGRREEYTEEERRFFPIPQKIPYKLAVHMGQHITLAEILRLYGPAFFCRSHSMYATADWFRMSHLSFSSCLSKLSFSVFSQPSIQLRLFFRDHPVDTGIL